MSDVKNVFDMSGKTVLITGAGGLLGPKHAEAVIEAGARAIITDHHEDRATRRAQELNEKYGRECAIAFHMDVTSKESIENVVDRLDRIDVLINNAAKDPKVKKEAGLTPDSRFETMTPEYWAEGLDVIAPDQRLYRKEGLAEEQQNVKPITYSAAKWAIVGMTKYLAVYFATRGIRVNCLSPTAVYNDHPEEFVEKLTNIIPMKRMSHIDEYKGSIVFLCSDASTYMTGENLVVDGGKSVW
jgi:NAD(P)-dependent dehydrogenase (short-subunit alcohol dehydrogenase family)